MKAPIFLIRPVKFYVQQMLFVKVINENVAKVRLPQSSPCVSLWTDLM